MYIPPFTAGVLVTLFAELVLFIVLAIWFGSGDGKGGAAA